MKRRPRLELADRDRTYRGSAHWSAEARHAGRVRISRSVAASPPRARLSSYRIGVRLGEGNVEHRLDAIGSVERTPAVEQDRKVTTPDDAVAVEVAIRSVGESPEAQ